MTWSQRLSESLAVLVSTAVVCALKIIGGVLIIAAGWCLAWVVRQVVVRVLRRLGVDRLSEKTRLNDVLRGTAIRPSAVELIGHVAYWLLLIAAIIGALQFMGVTVAAQWLERFGYVIPQIIVSVILLLAGVFFASFLAASARTAALNAGFPQGHLIGTIVYVLVVLLTVVIALEQLPVQTRTLEVAVYLILGTCGLTIALACGLGAQEFVKRLLEEWWDHWKMSQRP